MGDMEGWHVTGIATAVTSGDAEARLEQWTGDGKGDSGRVAWRTTRSAGPPGRADPWARAPGRVLRPGFFGPTDERAEEQGKEFLTLPSTLTTILANSELSMGTQGARAFCTLEGSRHGVVTPVERPPGLSAGHRFPCHARSAPPLPGVVQPKACAFYCTAFPTQFGWLVRGVVQTGLLAVTLNVVIVPTKAPIRARDSTSANHLVASSCVTAPRPAASTAI